MHKGMCMYIKGQREQMVAHESNVSAEKSPLQGVGARQALDSGVLGSLGKTFFTVRFSLNLGSLIA